MGVSFEVARVGTRYKPKLLPIDDNKAEEPPPANDSQPRIVEIGAEFIDDSNKKHKNVLHSTSEELEVSFSLNLFKDGFSIGKGNEFPSDVSKQLLPYDRASETLFSAIEYGWLPGDMLDDIPCKYVNGALMCEIRDYRHIFPYKEGHTLSAANVPIVHKLTLELCMETVVKDILSVSNDSWTYKDLLEVESCIIKALQPDLHLNPEPLGGVLFDKPRRKKLDLGIAWSWKKRKLSDEPMQGLPIRNLNLVNHASCTRKYKPQCGPLEKEKSTSSMQENVSSCYCSPQGINSALDYSSPSNALMVPKTPNFVDVPNQPLANDDDGMTIGNSIVPLENNICNKQSTKGIPYKKPKQEPSDLPKLQLVGSQVSIAPQGPEQQGVENGLQEQFNVDKILCESKKRKFHFPRSTHDDPMMLKGIQNHQIRAPSVKQEPAETSGCHTDVFCMNSSIGPSNLYNSKQQFLLKPLTVNSASIRSNHMDQSFDKCLKNGNAPQKRKISQNVQATAADGSLLTTQNSNSLQRKAAVTAERKNSRSRGLKAEMADSVINMGSRNPAGAKSLTVKSVCTPQQSVEVKNSVDRFSKILKVCERYKLINRKVKLDHIVRKKPSFCQIPLLVGVHLASFEDSGTSEGSVGYKISSSNFSSSRKTRMLIFSHEYHVIQRSDCPVVDDAAVVKLVMLENLDMGTVEVRVCYGHDGDHSVSLSLLPTFSGSLRSVNQFACQFTSLMIHEGYRIISDQVGSLPCNEEGELGIKKQPTVSNSMLTYRTVEPPATCIAGLSSPPLQNSRSRMPFQVDVAMQSPQPNILTGVNVTAGGNSLSSPQLTHNSSFNLEIDNLQQQMRSIQQLWQQSANKFLWLQYQMQLLKHLEEQELIPMTESTVHLGTAANSHDTVPLNGGRRIIRNIESSSCSHIMGITGSGPIFPEGLMRQLNGLSTSGYRQNYHILGLNYEQLFGALSDGRFAALPKLNTSQGQGFIHGLPALRNASMLSIANTDATNMRNTFNNQREPWAETSQRLHTVLQQDIRSMAMLGPKIAMPRLADQVVSSLPLVPSLHNNLPQLGTQRLNPISVPTSQQMNHGSTSGSGSPEVSAWTHGSVGNSNI
ncbi:hypothetical protein QN277_029224 [Acacia crassicarpa]|uniref:Uncharacterized protein n=1 Tax=Acacia crassicarpa TaxID=499986 RepID=A0AAE1J7D9_9FABA|nr:hypothetical protein QN277_029224 [Acacia crassicarpa]